MDSILIESPDSMQSVLTDSRESPVSTPHKNDRYIAMDEYSDPDSCSDYEIPGEEQLHEKEENIREMKEYLNDMKVRFIWDLSLAFKKQLCARNGLSSDVQSKIASISIDNIVCSFIVENPPPSSWLSFIMLKFSAFL